MQTKRTSSCIFRGQVALFGMHSLDTDECKPPCQMRVVDTVVATNVSYETYDNDFAVVTVYPPLEFTDEVSSLTAYPHNPSSSVDTGIKQKEKWVY